MACDRHRRAGAVPWALVLIALAGAGPASAEPGGDDDAFAQRVLEWTEAASQCDLERRALELASMPGALASYFALAARDAGADPAGEVAQLGEGQLRLLRRVAELFPAPDVIAHVRSGLGARPDEAWRRTALVLSGLHASSSQASLLAQLALAGRDAQPDPGLVESFTVALETLLRRQRMSAQELRWLADEAPALVEAILHAVGRAGDPEGMDWLASYLANPAFGAVALQELGRLAATSRGEQAHEIATAVHACLASPEEPRRRSALRALRALAQPVSVPRLLQHLGRAQARGEREMTLAALRAISGVHLPDDAAAWSAWFQREKQWVTERAEACLARLAAEDVGEVVGALHELALHPLQRERLAAPLVALLAGHDSGAVRAEVCVTLARLGAEAAIPQLKVALEDDEPGVRASADAALCTLTGLLERRMR